MVVVSALWGWGVNKQAVIVGGMYVLEVSGKSGKRVDRRNQRSLNCVYTCICHDCKRETNRVIAAAMVLAWYLYTYQNALISGIN